MTERNGTMYRMADIPPRIASVFPHIKQVWENADAPNSPCREEWEIVTQSGAVPVSAHAHSEEGVICVPKNTLHILWDGNGNPKSVLLHEYAHILLPRLGHSDEFWNLNRELHNRFGVGYNNGKHFFSDWYYTSIGVIFSGVCISMMIAGNMHPAWGVPLVIAAVFKVVAFGYSLRNPYSGAKEHIEKLGLENDKKHDHYRGFLFRLKNNKEIEIWARSKEAKKIWRGIDNNISKEEITKRIIFCGVWRPPSVDAMKKGIDALWDKHEIEPTSRIEQAKH